MYPDITRDDIFMLETRRLWLRWLRMSDVQAVVRLAGDKRISDMTARIPHPMTVEDAENFVFNSRKLNADGNGLALAITAKNKPNALLGCISIRHDPGEGKPHLGYWVGQPSWGLGVATEAVELMIDSFFFSTREQELAATVMIENEASRRVLIKSGMELTGSGWISRPAHGDRVAVDHFRLTRAAWSEKMPWMQPSEWLEPTKAAAA